MHETRTGPLTNSRTPSQTRMNWMRKPPRGVPVRNYPSQRLANL